MIEVPKATIDLAKRFEGFRRVPKNHPGRAYPYVCPAGYWTFADEKAIADFGVGKNMVASIRHWALVCGVMLKNGDSFRIRSLAKEILSDGGLDPYAESPSTAWLVHWQLAGRFFRSTTWHWLFNHVTAPTFTRQELEEPLARYLLEKQQREDVGLEVSRIYRAAQDVGGFPEVALQRGQLLCQPGKALGLAG